MAEQELGPEVIPQQCSIEGDLITVTFVLRSQQHENYGRAHVIEVRAASVASEAAELWEALVDFIQAYEVLEAAPPAQIRQGSTSPWASG